VVGDRAFGACFDSGLMAPFLDLLDDLLPGFALRVVVDILGVALSSFPLLFLLFLFHFWVRLAGLTEIRAVVAEFYLGEAESGETREIEGKINGNNGWKAMG
jgi:hypothetical protein